MKRQNSALLLIEFQQEWLSETGKLHHLFSDRDQFLNSLKNAEQALAAARQTSVAVIHSGLSYTDDYKELGKARYGLRAAIPAHQTFLASSAGSQFAAPFCPQSGEFVVPGRTGSSVFSGSNLDNYLRNNQITTLYLMGYALHVCVESTLRAAHDLGYETILIEDASAAFTAQQKDHAIHNVVDHFGACITTQDYLLILHEEKLHHANN
jgi:nicotinamidase-related amidase